MTNKSTKVSIAPNSKESEMMVLGCMLTNVNNLNISSEALDSSDFYHTEHKTIFNVLKTAYKNDKPADTHLVCEELKRQDKLEKIGGVSYITSLAQYAGTSAYVEEYAELIKNKSILRQIINSSQESIQKSLSDPIDVKLTLDEAQNGLFLISKKTSRDCGVEIKDLISGLKSKSGLSFLEQVQKMQEKFLEDGKDACNYTGIPTGFIDLDNMINGLAPSNLIILASRPAMGKTALAMNIAENVCFRNNVPIGIFSLEMSAEQLLSRMICSQTEIEIVKFRSGSISGAEYQQIVSKVGQMQRHTMVIDDQPGIQISDLRSRARRMKEVFGIEFIIIDYLQLITGSSNMYRQENRQQEISEISRLLKNLARELDIPILCLSQLSRKVEDRQDHRPMMSDLRESGAIEQDADIVMFLLRREYYDPYDKPGLAEVIIGKNRHGEVGSVNMSFSKSFVKFANLSYAEEKEDSDRFTAFEDHLKH